MAVFVFLVCSVSCVEPPVHVCEVGDTVWYCVYQLIGWMVWSKALMLVSMKGSDASFVRRQTPAVFYCLLHISLWCKSQHVSTRYTRVVRKQPSISQLSKAEISISLLIFTGLIAMTAGSNISFTQWESLRNGTTTLLPYVCVEAELWSTKGTVMQKTAQQWTLIPGLFFVCMGDIVPGGMIG